MVCADARADRPRLRVRLGQQGRAYTQRRYDWESVIARYAAFLELVVQRAAR